MAKKAAEHAIKTGNIGRYGKYIHQQKAPEQAIGKIAGKVGNVISSAASNKQYVPSNLKQIAMEAIPKSRIR